MARQKTKSYSESFRKEAVRLADLPDKTAMDVADSLGINVAQIYNWRNQFKRLSEKQFNTLDDDQPLLREATYVPAFYDQAEHLGDGKNVAYTAVFCIAQENLRTVL